MTNDNAYKNTTAELFAEGLEILCNNARIISMLPLEDWRAAFDRAETLGPVIDPTLYRDYLSTGRGEIIKDVLDAAIVLKRAVLKHQTAIANGRT